MPRHDPDFPIYPMHEVLDCSDDVPELESLLRWAMVLPYAGVYAGTYLANAALVHLLMTHGGAGPRVALAISLAVVTPFSFLLNHAILGRDARPHA